MDWIEKTMLSSSSHKSRMFNHVQMYTAVQRPSKLTGHMLLTEIKIIQNFNLELYNNPSKTTNKIRRIVFTWYSFTQTDLFYLSFIQFPSTQLALICSHLHATPPRLMRTISTVDIDWLGVGLRRPAHNSIGRQSGGGAIPPLITPRQVYSQIKMRLQ